RGHRRKGKVAQDHRVERDGIARVAPLRNRAQADDLARQEEPLDLLATLGVIHISLHGTAAYGGDRVELIAFAKDVFALFEGSDVLDEHVQLAQLRLAVAALQAGSGECARAAEADLIAVIGDRVRPFRGILHARASKPRARAQCARSRGNSGVDWRAHRRLGSGNGRSTLQSYAGGGAREKSRRSA